MQLIVGFVLIFCAMETVRCSDRSAPSQLWNYLKEFAWDRSSTDANNDRGPVVPLQVRIMLIIMTTYFISYLATYH